MNKELLVRVSHIIEELENNNFYNEAEKLQKSLEESLDISSARTAQLSSVLTTLKPKPFKFHGLSALFDYGADVVKDVIEESESSENLFNKYYSDIIKIIDEIIKLNLHTDIDNDLVDLKKMINAYKDNFEFLKSSEKTETVAKWNSNTKKAIKGDLVSEIPAYAQSIIQGALTGGLAGSMLGVGTVPGAATGALHGLSSKLVDDVWYKSISNTGKAYIQAKDLQDKLNKLKPIFDKYSSKLSDMLFDLLDKIMKNLEEANLNNKEATDIEKYIRSFEKKIGLTGDLKKNLLDKVKSIFD